MPASNPKVSICIPAYEHAHLLERCLLSVAKQTFQDYEVIITDDSSHERLKQIVDKVNDKRFFYYKNDVSLGSPANWNRAVTYARGEYIKILHHDDWFSVDTALDEFVSVFAKNRNTAFVFSQFYDITPLKCSVHSSPRLFFDKLRRKPEVCLFLNGIGAPSVTMFKKEVKEIVFDISMKWYVDVIFYAEVLKKYGHVEYIKEPLLNITSGLETQVTTITSGSIKMKEAIYTFNKFGFFGMKKKLPLLLVLLFIELFRKYGIKKFAELEGFGFDKQVIERLKTAFFISKFPIHFKIYASIRIFIINHFPIRFNCLSDR